MSKTFALMGTVVAVALAFVTADMESPTQHRVRRGGRDLRRNPAFVVETPTAGSEDGADSIVAEPTKPAPDDKAADPTMPEMPDVLFETREIDNPDLVLCIADNGELPPVERIIELEILSEGEVFWYSKSGSKEAETDKRLGKMLLQRTGRHVAIVPHEWCNWMRFREICDVARRNGFSKRVWIGVGSEDEPKTIMYLPFRLDPERKPEIDPNGTYFRIGVKEGKNEQGEYTINGAPIDAESLGPDIAIAWMDWKKANPGVDEGTDDPATSPVILEVHRYTPMKLVVPIIDRLRGIDIYAERLGEPPKRR